ncbi:MAG: hypothetical protein Q9M28_04115 [Mariprofundaceae bacterium]|nr:hypothetical protein [Mariprofundaceae bacterium]
MYRNILFFCLSFLLSFHALAARAPAADALYPITAVIADPNAIEVYPSIAGEHLVYSLRDLNEYSVVQVNKNTLKQTKTIAAMQPHEAIRFGRALSNGQILYTSNRMGPVSIWLRNTVGESHTLIGNSNTFNGGLIPLNPSISNDGHVSAFDTTLQKTRRAIILNDYDDGFLNIELLGQTWRHYHSDMFRYKQGYKPTEVGTKNKFRAPHIFIVDRQKSTTTMLPNAQNPMISPNGEQMIFTRDTGGNYDLWIQNIDGSQQQRLTDSPFGEFEAAWSPDGRKIAFVSNKDAAGDVRLTSIYVMDLQSKQMIQLTNSPRATDGGPTWKDNQTILFHSNRDLEHWQSDTMKDWNIWSVQVPQ